MLKKFKQPAKLSTALSLALLVSLQLLYQNAHAAKRSSAAASSAAAIVNERSPLNLMFQNPHFLLAMTRKKIKNAKAKQPCMVPMDAKRGGFEVEAGKPGPISGVVKAGTNVSYDPRKVLAESNEKDNPFGIPNIQITSDQGDPPVLEIIGGPYPLGGAINVSTEKAQIENILQNLSAACGASKNGQVTVTELLARLAASPLAAEPLTWKEVNNGGSGKAAFKCDSRYTRWTRTVHYTTQRDPLEWAETNLAYLKPIQATNKPAYRVPEDLGARIDALIAGDGFLKKGMPLTKVALTQWVLQAVIKYAAGFPSQQKSRWKGLPRPEMAAYFTDPSVVPELVQFLRPQWKKNQLSAVITNKLGITSDAIKQALTSDMGRYLEHPDPAGCRFPFGEDPSGKVWMTVENRQYTMDYERAH